MVLLVFILLPLASGRTQEDQRIYHEAWYLEQVARKPLQALKRYRKLCELFPSSPLKEKALARQAMLLIRLHRPREADKVLEELKKQGGGKALDLDKLLLDSLKEDFEKRELLLLKLRNLRQRLNELRESLEKARKSRVSKEKIGVLRGELEKIHREIQKLRPVVLSTRPRHFNIKKIAQLKPPLPREALVIVKRIKELNKRIRKLRKEGRYEAAKGLALEAIGQIAELVPTEGVLRVGDGGNTTEASEEHGGERGT